MRWLPAVLVALLCLPVAAAQDPGLLEATLSVQVSLDPAAFTEVNPAREDPAQDALSRCGTGHLSASSDGRALRFSEESTEQGCAEARQEVAVPAGARAMEVRFGAIKSVLQPATAGAADLAISVASEVRVYGDEGLLVSFPFLRKDSRVETADDLVFTQPLSGAANLTLAWYFDDEGPTLRSGVPGPVFGQRVEVDILAPSVWFTGVPVAGEVESVRADVGRDTVDTQVRVPATVPDGVRAALRFSVRNTLSVDHVEVPGGAWLDDSGLMVQESGGVLSLELSPEVVAANGPGRYTAVFLETTALEPTPLLVPLILAIMVVPLPVGLYATRSARSLAKEATGGFTATTRALRASLYFWWAVYLGGLLFVLLFRLWPLIVAWPIQPQAAVLHGGFVLVTAAFVGLGFYWRRQVAATMQSELAEKHRTNTELARSNQELQQFAYVASHDLQEPLRTVGRFAQLVEQRYGDRLDDDGREFLGYTVDGARRMQVLIDNLLRFSRVETQGRPLERVDLDAIMERVKASLHARLEGGGGTIDHEGLPEVAGDRVQLAQLLQNLVGNALKFRAPDRTPRVQVRAMRDGAVWRIEVADNGIGIEPKYHDQIFTVFQRLHRREDYEGTGIGLALCKKIVERHGGAIGLTSRPGKGTTFFFTLQDGSAVAP